MRAVRWMFAAFMALPLGTWACGASENGAGAGPVGGAGGHVGLGVGGIADGGSHSGGSRGLGATAGAGEAGEAGQVDASGSAAIDAGANDGGALGDAGVPAKLTLSLDPTLNGDNDVKASSFSSAVLLSTSGATIATAKLAGENAVFNLRGLIAGDYFIEVNGDADDLVPTRIDDPSTDVSQRVGQALCASYIGSTAATVYRINTYSSGQGHGPAVKFSDGTPIPGEQPYALTSVALPKVEFRALGTAKLLSSTIVFVGTHGGQEPFKEPFDDWVFTTTGQDHHGDAFNADGGATSCASCHYTMDVKPTTFASITSAHGYCYRCHNGPDGTGAGFVDTNE